MDENASLRVRKGTQIFGPMSLVQLAELLASGRIAESDELSADGRDWQSITSYFEQQLAAESPPPPPPIEEPVAAEEPSSEEDDFLPTFAVDNSSSGPPSTLFDDTEEDEEEDEIDDEPISIPKPRRAKKRERARPDPTVDMDSDDDESMDDEDEDAGEGSSDLDAVLRKLLEHERSAPSIDEPRRRSASGGKGGKAPSLKMTPKERHQGFVMLFNGKNFSGWRFRENSSLPAKLPDNWKAERGCIFLTGGGKPSLMSQWDYSDFDFRFAWRAIDEQYNTGLCLRSERKIGKNQLCMRQGKEGSFRGGEIEGVESVEDLQNPPGEWNEWRVLAEGDSLTLWCNGKQAWEADGFDMAPGYLGFLAAGSQIEFGNLRIKELGFDYLNDLENYWETPSGKSGDWKQMGDSIVGGKGNKTPLETVIDDYQNFRLRLDWKLTKGAEGMLHLRGAECKEGAVQLGGAKKGSGGLPGIFVEPDESRDNPEGQWNFLEARVMNNVISIWLNGEDIVEKAKMPRGGTTAASGPIALSHNGRPIQFRNIRIRTMDTGKKSKRRGRD